MGYGFTISMLRSGNWHVHINLVVEHVPNGGLGGKAVKLPHIAKGSEGDGRDDSVGCSFGTRAV